MNNDEYFLSVHNLK